MLQRFLLAQSRPLSSRRARRLSFSSLGFLAALSATAPVFAQTPAPDNYLAIVADSSPFFVNDVDKNVSSSFAGVADYLPAAYSVYSNITRTPLPLTPAVTGFANRGVANAVSGSRIAGYRVNNGYSEAVAWERFGIFFRYDLHAPVASYFGSPASSIYSNALAVDADKIVGSGGRKGQPEQAFLWEPSAQGYSTTNLPPYSSNLYTIANGVSGDVIVGQSGSDAVEWIRASNTGRFVAVKLAANNAVGASATAAATAITDGVIVGYGSGANTNYFRHAVRWFDGPTIDLHQAANLDALCGAGAQSEAKDTTGGVTIGSATGQNLGTLSRSGDSVRFASHAVRWAKDANGVLKATDLQPFLPQPLISQTIPAYTEATAIADDGTILGTAANFPQFGTVSATSPTVVNVIWKPLPGVLQTTIPEGMTGYLNRAFTQTAPASGIYVLGTMKNSTMATLTIAGGELGGKGRIEGFVVNSGGSLVPHYKANGAFFVNYYYQYSGGRMSVNVSTKYIGGYPTGIYEANRVDTTYASLSGQLSLSRPVTMPIGTSVVILTSKNLSGSFTGVTPGWRLTYNRTSGNSSIVATYTGN